MDHKRYLGRLCYSSSSYWWTRSKRYFSLDHPLKVEGVSTRQIQNSGVGASGSTFITFDDVKVPVENLIHKENRGFEVIMSNFNAERKGIATQAIRLSRVCCEDAWKHACTRETFGTKLMRMLSSELNLRRWDA